MTDAKLIQSVMINPTVILQKMEDLMIIDDAAGFDASQRTPVFTTFVATDGSLHNKHGKFQAGGGIVILRKRDIEIFMYTDETTIISIPMRPEIEDINRTEILTVVEFLQQFDEDPAENLHFLVDSQTLLDNLYKLVEGKTPTKFKSQMSADIYSDAVLLFNTLLNRTGCCLFEKVVAHTDSFLNNLADAAAKKAARGKNTIVRKVY